MDQSMVYSVEFIRKMEMKWDKNFKLIRIVHEIKDMDTYKHFKTIILSLFGQVMDKIDMDTESMVKYL